jgi:hypothetical protein
MEGGKTFADGEFGEFGDTEQVQYFRDVLSVYLDGLLADVQFSGNLFRILVITPSKNNSSASSSVDGQIPL